MPRTRPPTAPRSTKSKMDVPNRARYEAAAAKTMIVMVKRLRWLTPDALARLIEAGQFEQLIRAQAEVDERETTAAGWWRV